MRDPIGPAAIALVAATAWLLIVFLGRSYRQRSDDVHRLGKDLARTRAELQACEADLKHAQAMAGVGTTQDLAARKELEASLREQQEFFRLISESIGEHIAVLDLEGQRLYNSPSYRQIFGDTRELRGSDSFADVHPDDRERVQQVFRQTTRTGRGQQIEYRLVRQDGSVRHMASSGKVITDKQGRAARVVVVSHDITDRKQAEQWERIAATAFESQQGMFITDAHSVILRVNQAFTAITGYSAADCIGRTPKMLGSGRHDAAFYAAMRASIEGTGVWRGEIWNRRKNGEVFPEWLTISAVRDGEGKVTHYVSALTDISEYKAAQEEIERLAFYDALTGLPNRRLLHDRLRVAIATSARSDRQGALLFIDLDNFKTLNDTLGHDMGDHLLRQVAKRLSGCVRERDTVARLGGDEFVIMLDDLDGRADEGAGQCRIVGEKVLAVLNHPYDLAGHEYQNTPSIGVTLFGGQHGSAIEDLMKRADLAMYEAKAAGRNTLRFFDPRMQAVVTARAALEKDLREAIRKQDFVLHYQPQVDDVGRTIGAEALLRWQHEQRGIVLPAEFIPLAEETGLILPLGLWVLETACAQAALWAALPGREHFTVSVNVSARQFRLPNFVEQVLTVLAASTDPHNLELELTESMLLDNIEDIIAKMTALKERGVSFSLDDFGIGYSSLSYLKRLPLDQLKIDQSFVRGLLTDPNDEVIARTIITLAGSLGLSVIAEGVETVEQRDVLAAQGCHAYQGYLFSRPLPAADFERFLQAP